MVVLSALPAMWVRMPPLQVIEGFAAAVQGIVQGDLVYVRVNAGVVKAQRIERAAGPLGKLSTAAIRQALKAIGPWRRILPSRLGRAPDGIVVTFIGHAASGLGRVVVVSHRESFPNDYDRLLVRMATNHLAVALQSSQIQATTNLLAERMRAEEALRRSETRLHSLLEQSSDMLSLHQPDGTATFVSASATRLLGYQPGDMPGHNRIWAIDPQDRRRFERVFADVALRPGHVATDRHRIVNADGTRRWIEATVSNLLGEPAVGAIVINRHDVTEEHESKKLLESRVAERTRELESLYRADETIYGAFHLDGVIKALLDVSAEILEVDRVAVLLRPDLDASAGTVFSRGFTAAEAALVFQSIRRRVVGRILTTKEPAAAARVRAPDGLWSALLVPILVGGEVFAVFTVLYAAPHRFGVEERRLLLALARRTGLAIENALRSAAEVDSAALEERNRLARELHDSVSQGLYAIRLSAAAAEGLLGTDPDAAAALLRDVGRLVDGAVAEMRALILELRPQSLEEEGLIGAIGRQVSVPRERYHLPITAVFGAEPDLPLATKEAVYRVAQEALNNIAKHAAATSVQLTLELTESEVTLRVTDDGVGFLPEQSFPGHLGLQSMRERAAGAGSRLDVRSAAGKGTEISLTVPLAGRAGGSPRPAGDGGSGVPQGRPTSGR